MEPTPPAPPMINRLLPAPTTGLWTASLSCNASQAVIAVKGMAAA